MSRARDNPHWHFDSALSNMLSYRHGFHAGNPADVFKHTVLIALVRAMQEKDKAIAFVDSHSGPAVYDLDQSAALKNREFDKGIGRIWQEQPTGGPRDDYVERVRAWNPDGQLRFYPGSPALLRSLLRKQDRLVLCELHPTEQKALVERFAGDRQVVVETGDGYTALAKHLPPASGRGLVLIDPSYELRTELESIASALKLALKRFGHGVYAIWYPVIEGRATTPDALPGQLGLSLEQWLDLRIEFPADRRLGRMSGCGMAIINCPYRARRVLLDLQAGWG